MYTFYRVRPKCIAIKDNDMVTCTIYYDQLPCIITVMIHIQITHMHTQDPFKQINIIILTICKLFIELFCIIFQFIIFSFICIFLVVK